MKTSLSQPARYLVLLTSAVLTIFGFGSLTRLAENPDLAGFYIFYAFAMLVISAVLLFCYFQLKKRRKNIFWLTSVILALNIVLTIFDQVGFVDILFMLLNLVTLVTLYLSRKDFLPE